MFIVSSQAFTTVKGTVSRHLCRLNVKSRSATVEDNR
jgi:hypothetical protein